MNTEIPQLSIQPNILLLLQRLHVFFEKKDIKAYVVGGLVRDALLDRDTNDVDIAIAADGLETARGVASPQQVLITPCCGLATLSEEAASHALELLSDLSSRMRSIYL